MKDHPTVLPWWLSLPLIIFVETVGLASCGAFGNDAHPDHVTPAGSRVEIVYLSDGTRCAVLSNPNLHAGGITCQWEK